MEDGLGKAKGKAKHLEQKAKEDIERIARAEKDEEAKVEAQVARLATFAVGNTKSRSKEELARVRDALVAAEEAKRKVEDELAYLEVERTSFLLDIRAAKDEVSSLQS